MVSSDSESGELTRLIERARNGDRDALRQLLEAYRGYLRTLARRRLAAQLGRRFDASDLVQQTFLDAHQNFAQFAGSHEPELLAWLRRILRCNIANAMRDNLTAQKRAMGIEQSLDESARGANLLNQLASGSSTPSARAIHVEESLQFLQAIEELPADQRDAVRLRHLDGMPLREIAEQFGRSEAAVAGLIKRGVQALRRRLSDTPEV